MHKKNLSKGGSKIPEKKMENEINDLCFLASTANEINRYSDMIEIMKKVVCLNPKLGHDQRILFSTAFHEYVSEKRQNLIVLESCAEHISNEIQKNIIVDICNELRNEVHEICCDAIQTVMDQLLPNNDEVVVQLFYYKMAADYYRYDAEVMVGENKEPAIKKAEEMYDKAIDIAKNNSLYLHPLFLGLILNYCVFLVDIRNNVTDAKRIAEDVIKNTDKILVEYPDLRGESEICLKLIKDNIELWEETV